MEDRRADGRDGVAVGSSEGESRPLWSRLPGVGEGDGIVGAVGVALVEDAQVADMPMARKCRLDRGKRLAGSGVAIDGGAGTQHSSLPSRLVGGSSSSLQQQTPAAWFRRPAAREANASSGRMDYCRVGFPLVDLLRVDDEVRSAIKTQQWPSLIPL